MEHLTSAPMADFCWVYVTREIRTDNAYRIALAVDLPQLIRDSAGKQLLYYRQFSTTLDAVAHKLLLSEVGNETLRTLLQAQNPMMRDLAEEFNIKK